MRLQATELACRDCSPAEIRQKLLDPKLHKHCCHAINVLRATPGCTKAAVKCAQNLCQASLSLRTAEYCSVAVAKQTSKPRPVGSAKMTGLRPVQICWLLNSDCMLNISTSKQCLIMLHAKTRLWPNQTQLLERRPRSVGNVRNLQSF